MLKMVYGHPLGGTSMFDIMLMLENKERYNCPGIQNGCAGFRLNECQQDYTQCGLYQNAMNENNFEKNKK